MNDKTTGPVRGLWGVHSENNRSGDQVRTLRVFLSPQAENLPDSAIMDQECGRGSSILINLLNYLTIK